MVRLDVVDISTPSSPSAARRKSLRTVADRASSEFRVLETCPLERYADVADRLLDRFCEAASEHRLDEAYVLGLRFANLCLSGLPRHPSWNNRQASSPIDDDDGDDDGDGDDPRMRTGGTGGGEMIRVRTARLTSETAVVLRKLAVLKQRMDAEEIAKLAAETRRRDVFEARQRESDDRREAFEEDVRCREQAIRERLDKERDAFRASQRHLLVRAPTTRTTTTTTTTKRRPVFHRIWSK